MLTYYKNLNWLKLAKILLILIIFYIILVFSISVFKYLTYSYNVLDLAIFNQVFYNSSLGNFFQFTIHPTSYLGDHFTPLLFLLVPFYSVLKSPLTLLFIQTLFLALAAVPLFLIAKKYLNPQQTLLIIFLYLFNPVTLNINLHEFHLLALVPFFIGWTFYFYQQNKFVYFFIFSLLSLQIREDVAFIIFMFGIIALLDKKNLKWILSPLILATVYFFTALKIISHFSAASTYKFFVYYQWLGNTPYEIFINFFIKFPLVLEHVFSLTNLELILGFGLVFLFIPFYRPKYLLLSLGMFLQLILGTTSGELILRIHYGSVFLIVFSLTAIFALKALTTNKKLKLFSQKYTGLFTYLIIIGFIYTLLVLGPLIPFVKSIYQTNYQQVSLKNEFVKQIPRNASVVTTYDLMANLSSRTKIYSLNYIFLGRQQFNAGAYIIPENTEFILINFNDFIAYHLQYETKATTYYYQGDNNLINLLSKNYQLIKISQNLGLWQKNSSLTDFSLYQVHETQKPNIENIKEQIIKQKISFLGFNQAENKTSLFFKPQKKLEKNYFIQINKQIYPLGYGLYPTSEWQAEQIIQMDFYDIELPNKIQLLEIAGWLAIDKLGNTQNHFTKFETIGEIIIN